jgi:hypothetical protein
MEINIFLLATCTVSRNVNLLQLHRYWYSTVTSNHILSISVIGIDSESVRFRRKNTRFKTLKMFDITVFFFRKPPRRIKDQMMKKLYIIPFF